MSYEQPAPGLLIAESIREIDWERVYRLDTRRYGLNYLTADDANNLPWDEFCQNKAVIDRGQIPNTELDFALVSKTVTWSDRDINVYVGANGRTVKSYMDLTKSEFDSVFTWNVDLAAQIASATGSDTYVTHGFNPDDSAPDAHSIRSRMHTHIHIPNLAERYRTGPNITTFEKLMLVEPFSELFWDALQHDAIAEPWKPQRAVGFVSLEGSLSKMQEEGQQDIHRILEALHANYTDVVSLFTDGTTELATGHSRYEVFPTHIRQANVQDYVELNSDWLGARSTALLHYMGSNILHAKPRVSPSSQQLDTAANIWIAKGFSGALNYRVSHNDDKLEFALAPRIISSSGATKVLSTDPTIIAKDKGEATLDERRRMQEYEALVKDVADVLPVRTHHHVAA